MATGGTPRNLILSGGVAHDFATTSSMVAAILGDAGIRSYIRNDIGFLGDGALNRYDLITLNCARWTCMQPQVDPAWRREAGFEMPPAGRDELDSFVADGGGLLALHCATLCFDDWPGFGAILGARWEWGESGTRCSGWQDNLR